MAVASSEGKGRYFSGMRVLLPKILSLFFAVVGVSKLMGWLPALERFYQWQLPGWWMVYVVGVIQLAGGVALWRARSRGPAALVLAVTTMVMLSAQMRFAWWWDAVASMVLIVLLLFARQAGSTSTSTPPAP